MVRKLLIVFVLGAASRGVTGAEGGDRSEKALKRTTTRTARRTTKNTEAAACKATGDGCNNGTDCCSGACGNATSGKANSGTCL
jgi:hypothetical protein